MKDIYDATPSLEEKYAFPPSVPKRSLFIRLKSNAKEQERRDFLNGLNNFVKGEKVKK